MKERGRLRKQTEFKQAADTRFLYYSALVAWTLLRSREQSRAARLKHDSDAERHILTSFLDRGTAV